MADIWSDASFLTAACDIEAAWVDAAVAEGCAPLHAQTEMRARIGQVLKAPERLLPETRRVGRPIAPLVDALAEGASLELQKVLHLGLTTQDVVDGASVLLRRNAMAVCDAKIAQLIAIMNDMSDAHHDTLMPARTNDQIAGVTTLGLFLAEAAAELARGQERIAHRHEATQYLNLTGAIGLSAPFGTKTSAVRHRAAQLLDLAHDPAQTAAPRDRIADLHLALGLLTKSLSRIAGTVAALQAEGIGELSERHPGSSSAMPQKTNPRLAEEVRALGMRMDGHLLTALSATQTRHHRSGDSWRLEWAASIEIFTTLYTSLRAAVALFKRLDVRPEVMAAHLGTSKLRAYADRLFTTLSIQVGRTSAKDILSRIDLATCAPTQLIAALRHLSDDALDEDTIRKAISSEEVKEAAESKRKAIRT